MNLSTIAAFPVCGNLRKWIAINCCRAARNTWKQIEISKPPLVARLKWIATVAVDSLGCGRLTQNQHSTADSDSLAENGNQTVTISSICWNIGQLCLSIKDKEWNFKTSQLHTLLNFFILRHPWRLAPPSWLPFSCGLRWMSH